MLGTAYKWRGITWLLGGDIKCHFNDLDHTFLASLPSKKGK
eukprot:Gb_21897 [translate_table: standard]